MGACLACVACQACVSAASICFSCIGCGRGGESNNDPFVGRVRALSVMLFSLILAIIGQYWLYEYFESLDAWEDGCENTEHSEDFVNTCVGNTWVYRVSFIDSAFFLLMTFCACCSPAFNNGFWGFKFLLWVAAFIACLFVTNDVFNTTGYVWVARIGAFIFTIMQQLVLIDLAYRINDALVTKSNEQGEGSDEGKPFLVVLVSASAFLFVGSLCAIGAMFHYFRGCPANELVLSLTLILPIVMTLLQLSGSEGNLLTSAVVTAYTTFLCFSAVSKTPTSDCNPFVGEANVSVVLIGIGLTVLSLFWVTLNAARTVTALLGGTGDRVTEQPGPVQTSATGGVEAGDKSKPFVQNAVITSEEGTDGSSAAQARPATASPVVDSATADDGGLGWRFNVVMVLISMFYAMMLTNWGDINEDGESSDPKNGWTAMWLTTTGQWVCFILYGWTLIAPRVFPDRDFS